MPALVALLLASLVGGCASIPTHGPALPGRGGEQGPANLDVIPPPPPRGAGPADIVRGFLLAAGGTDTEYSTAREFLSPARAASWRPDTGTTVYSGQTLTLTVLADGRAVPSGSPVSPEAQQVQVTVRAGVVASIDARGRYTAAAPDATHETTVSLTKVDGQWRIDALDDGVLLDQSFLGLAYRSFELFFLDPTGRVLVPEIRWFPRGDSNATLLTRELLAGPSAWWAGAVRTSVPQGTELARPGVVPLTDGIARVDLTSSVLSASLAERALLLVQLRATLLPVESVDDVRVSVDGGEIEVPENLPRLTTDPLVDAFPVALSGGTLVRIGSGGSVEPVDGLPDLSPVGPSHPAMSHANALGRTTPLRFAVLAAERSQLLLLVPGQTTEPLHPVVVGADLTPPSFDPLGWLWTTSANSLGTLTAVSPAGEQHVVAAAWLTGRRVTAVRASRDGTRLAVASTDAQGRGRVEVIGVVRSEDGVPTALSAEGPLDVGPRLVRAEDVAWVNDVTVAALGRDAGDDADQVHVLRIGGLEQPPLTPVPGANGVTAGNGEGTILVRTSSGAVFEQAGASWLPLRVEGDVREPAFAG